MPVSFPPTNYEANHPKGSTDKSFIKDGTMLANITLAEHKKFDPFIHGISKFVVGKLQQGIDSLLKLGK